MVARMDVWLVSLMTCVLTASHIHADVIIREPAADSKMVVVGENVNLMCLNTDGGDLQWWADREPFGEMMLDSNPPFVITALRDNDGSKLYLTIEGVELEDSTKYTCKSADGSGEAHVTLTVVTADAAPPAGWVTPAIDRRERQETIEVEAGKELRLKCQGGSKDSVLEFRHNGDVIEKDTHNLMTKATDVAQNLATVILSRDPAVADYSGTYTCRDVDFPDPSDSVEVEVLDHPSTRVEIIEPSGADTKVMIGDNFSLKCQSSDRTTMIWYHDDEEIQDEIGGFLIMIRDDFGTKTRTSMLTKEGAEIGDAGEYRCVNADSPQDDATIEVDVRAEGDDDDNDDDDDGGDDDDNDEDEDDDDADDDDDGFLHALFSGATCAMSSTLVIFLGTLLVLF